MVKKSSNIITGYKAFDPDFKCQDYQYEVGKTFEHNGKIQMCYKGFHFCHDDPIDVFNYYPLVHREHGLSTRFAKVSVPKKEAIVKHTADKCVTSKISIDEEITLEALINEQVEKAYNSEDKAGSLIATNNRSTLIDKDSATKIISNKMGARVALTSRYSRALVSADGTYLASSAFSTGLFSIGGYVNVSSSGNFTKIYSNGQYSSISSSGCNAELRIKGAETSIATSGDVSTLNVEGKNVSVSSSGKASNLNVTGAYASVSTSGLFPELTVKGDFVATASSGENTTLRITGDGAGVASSGDYSKLTVTGDGARIASVGEFGRVIYEGKDGVITILGGSTKFKGSKGTLVLAVICNHRGKPVGGLVGRIGENGLKSNTLYRVSGGEFVEVEAANE